MVFLWRFRIWVQPSLFDLELSFQAVIDQRFQAFVPTYSAMKDAHITRDLTN